MKNKILAIIIVVCLLCVALTLVACKKDPNDKQADYLITALPSVTASSDVAEHTLTIEWVDGNGNSTAFVRNKPTAVIFHGKAEYDRKEKIDFDESVYQGVKKDKSNLIGTAKKWEAMGFNVGIFHYEAFADDTDENVNAKIYNSANMTYVNTDGLTVVNTPSYNLTEAFVSAWTKIAEPDLASDNGLKQREVRFIGNGVGACLALSVADYLEEAYNAKLISDAYLPNRIDLVDPYLSNDGSATVVGYRYQRTLGSALEYNKDVVVKLTDLGTVINMVESDAEFYNSYATRYTGVEVVEPTEDGGKQTVNFNDIGDYAMYKTILSRVAYFEFRENYSKDFDAYHKNRATLDWYLYTVRGSDDVSVTTISGSDIRPMIDGFNITGTSVYSSVKYAVTSWTSTVYLRAVRGHVFKMVKHSGYGGNVKHTDFVMNEFMAESYQTSDLTMDNAYGVCGYVTVAGANPTFVNFRRSMAVVDVTVQIEASKEGETTEYYTVTTDKSGFYFLNLGKDKLGYSVNVRAILPSRDFVYADVGISSSENYLIYDKNKISTASGTNLTMSATKDQNFFILFVNCGLKRA